MSNSQSIRTYKDIHMQVNIKSHQNFRSYIYIYYLAYHLLSPNMIGRENLVIVLPLIFVCFVLLAFVSHRSKLPHSSVTSFYAGDSPAGGVASASVCPDAILTSDCSSTSSPVLGGVDVVKFFTDFKNADGTYDVSFCSNSSLSIGN